jgi:hypothetical protein
LPGSQDYIDSIGHLSDLFLAKEKKERTERPMELFSRLFGSLLIFVYHCFDRVVINGYLSGISRPEQVVYFFREVLHIPVITKEVLRQRTKDYQNWVEAFARNHNTPMEWAQKGVRKEDAVSPWLRRMEKRNAYGVYFIFRSMEQAIRLESHLPNMRPRIPITALLLLSAIDSPITIFTSGMKSWEQ